MYKIAYGCVLLALSYVVIAFAAWVGGTGQISWLWLLAFFVLITTGEIYLSPISLSLYSKVAPARIISLMIGGQFRAQFPGRRFHAGLAGHLLGDGWAIRYSS